MSEWEPSNDGNDLPHLNPVNSPDELHKFYAPYKHSMVRKGNAIRVTFPDHKRLHRYTKSKADTTFHFAGEKPLEEDDLHEMSLSRIVHHSNIGKGYVMMSADRSEPHATREQAHRKAMLKHLRDMGHSFTHLKGGYTEKTPTGDVNSYEHTIMVHNVGTDEAHALDKYAHEHHQQQEVLHVHPERGAHLIAGETGATRPAGDEFTTHPDTPFFSEWRKRKFAFRTKKPMAASIGMESADAWHRLRHGDDTVSLDWQVVEESEGRPPLPFDERSDSEWYVLNPSKSEMTTRLSRGNQRYIAKGNEVYVGRAFNGVHRDLMNEVGWKPRDLTSWGYVMMKDPANHDPESKPTAMAMGTWYPDSSGMDDSWRGRAMEGAEAARKIPAIFKWGFFIDDADTANFTENDDTVSLIEARIEKIKTDDGEVHIHWNPTKDELANLAEKHGHVRGMAFGNDYGFWPSYKATHGPVAEGAWA